ncbi:MAG TPA: PilN domain-containing protein, partial [Candidatus Saccharimonadales bacterium]|nr:PilN domain-containing protein [Candidatus Saccharimonadales bacterium]
MIQLNLLPDVKMEYIKAQRQRRLVTSISVIVTVAAVGLLGLLLSIDGLQKKHLSDLSRDIKNDSAKLQGEPQIKKVLTVQNQLSSLPALHDSAPATSRLFGYLNQITPVTVNITDYSVDFAEHTMSITGTSASLASVNQYVDTLKNTSYTSDGGEDSQPAFSDVVLSNFSLNTDTQSIGSGQAANYTIDMAYDENIFDITQKVKLSVP